MTKDEILKFIGTLDGIKNSLQDVMDEVDDLKLELESESEEAEDEA